jgi:O-ureido-D-serine cyclo-ligase
VSRTLCFVTDQASLPNDYDMTPLVDACQEVGLDVEVNDWDDASVDWARFGDVVFRSPWSYLTQLPAFLDWCERVDSVTTLRNPLPVVRWTLDKHYLADLEAHGVPTIPTAFVESPTDVPDVVDTLGEGDVVVKPAIGAYSHGVQGFRRHDRDGLTRQLHRLLDSGQAALVQPYMTSIDTLGETDLIYFDGAFSHAICKESLLDPSGVAREPTQDVRSARKPDADEHATAERALDAVATILSLDDPLLYARVDLVKDEHGAPRVHEMELCEPSLSLAFSEGAARRFAEALSRRLQQSA